MKIEDYIVDSNMQLSDAVAQMTKNAVKGLVVVENEKVVGVFTRRDLVNCSHVFGIRNVPIKAFINENFNYCLNKVDEKYKNSKHTLIPVLNEKKELIDIYFPKKTVYINKYHYPVVVMAGGLGTRLYPYTKVLPKPLVPVIDDKPMVEMIMDSFNNYGSDDFYLIVNHKKEMIKSYFEENDHNYNVHYGEEIEQLGTGGGLYYVKDQVKETFYLTNCDILTLEDYDEIYEYHKNAGNVITMIVSLKSVHVPYGVIHTDENQNLVGSTEKTTYMILVNTGVYIVEPDVFNYIGCEEKVDFPTVINRIKNDGKKVGIYPITEDKWLDMGQINELENSRQILSSLIKEEK